VTVGKPATKAHLFVECLPKSGAAGGQWSGTVEGVDDDDGACDACGRAAAAAQ
jgi:hypothetical protein